MQLPSPSPTKEEAAGWQPGSQGERQSPGTGKKLFGIFHETI
jgi:hypothetical protein